MGRPVAMHMVGKTYGDLTVLEFDHVENQRSFWKCLCTCGNIVVKGIQGVKTSHRNGCGCNRKGVGRTHGQTNTRLYKIWLNMRQRCLCETHHAYRLYGGRGISICDEWSDFVVFKYWADANGYEEGLSIERVDVNGGYCPENCTWIERRDQPKNTRANRKITHNGETRTVAEWSRITGLPHATIMGRLRRKLPVEDVLNPKRERNRDLIVANGEEHTATEWSRITGIGVSTICFRRRAGWSDQDCIKPVVV